MGFLGYFQEESIVSIRGIYFTIGSINACLLACPDYLFGLV